MNLAGNTPVVVNGKNTRVLSHEFNRALKTSKDPMKLEVKDEEGNLIVPSKGLTWSDVATAIRTGKKVQAKTEKTKRAA